MSEALVKLARANRKEPNDHEKRALAALRKDAKAAGATLANNGEGGLPSSKVLGVMRRDKFQCKKCGGNKNLSLHHKGGVVKSKWLSKKGHNSVKNNLVTVCEDCHDDTHEEARAEGTDSSQVKPQGDKEQNRGD